MQIEQAHSQEQLVRGLAHRMNNILTLFHGYVGLMLDNQDLDTTTRANLSKIKEGATAASELMDRTHALVRPANLVARELDLPFFMGLLGPTLQRMCGERVKLSVVIGPHLPRLLTDASRLKAALLELVRNACEALDCTGGNVRIEVSSDAATREVDAADGGGTDRVEWITFAVIDDGPGVPAEAHSRIFQPFFTMKRRKNAAGLGLNVATDAVQHLGGILRHASQPGETRFEILLPAAVEATA